MSRRKVAESVRVCSNKDCVCAGVAQPIELFLVKRPGIVSYRRECNSCRARKNKEYRQKNEKAIAEGREWIDDDDDYSDLVPMEAGGFVRWAVITTERREAHGETSPFNGRSIGVETEWN